MDKLNEWDRMITVAWLMRLYGEYRHPPKAEKIRKRFAANIARAEAYRKHKFWAFHGKVCDA